MRKAIHYDDAMMSTLPTILRAIDIDNDAATSEVALSTAATRIAQTLTTISHEYLSL